MRDTADPDDDEEVQLYRGLLGSGEPGSDSESEMSMVGVLQHKKKNMLMPIANKKIKNDPL